MERRVDHSGSVDFYSVAKAHADRVFLAALADNEEYNAACLLIIAAEVVRTIIITFPDGDALPYKERHEKEIEDACLKALADAGFKDWKKLWEQLQKKKGE